MQPELIAMFKVWGMPKSIRVDNGKPLGAPQRKSITELGLWLTGLGINVIYNRPRQPTDNAKVERMQRTTKNWAVIKSCKTISQLREALQSAIIMQREHYQVSRLGKKTRAEVYPEIFNNPRKYSKELFEEQKAYLVLSKWTFVRKISSHGQFSIYGQIYYLGIKYAKQNVSIKFNIETIGWDISDSQGNLLKSLPAKNFTKEHILKLTINQRTNKSKN